MRGVLSCFSDRQQLIQLQLCINGLLNMLLGIELAFLLQLSHAERAAVFHFALGDGSGHANGNAI